MGFSVRIIDAKALDLAAWDARAESQASPAVQPRPHRLAVWGLAFALLLGAFTADAKPKPKKDEPAEADKKAPEWDVANPPGERYDVSIDVTRGTWMSLDVSPDGREIVFDLLGDLYVIPIAGGEAKALTQGLPWDMQPRYSPDGRAIAFTSDRGGGDNIWVMGRDGSNPKAVTKEDFRLLNSPAWSPDSEFIIAHKHFSSRRSLGSGEIWLYHKSGGDGLQLTTKPNEQKDVGEPVFSPDGRYVYFSQDTTRGLVFEYNKDPNNEIYTIRRLDRETGEIEPFITGPGGAVRPTPSPDGKSLAFIRRVRYQSVLFVRDLESGKNRPLYDQLDRDMQETWAVHGVYPTLAWTPDSQNLVFWAGGKLHRLTVADGQVREIPFHVRQTHQMASALRFPIEVAPAQFMTRMLRFVQVSPRGDQVVLETLGRLYVRDLPAGEPRRLTQQQDHFELYPSYSRDGSAIVYTTWDDEKLGSVRIVPASGGEGRVLTPRPGHFVEPCFSPDGATVVYRKTDGGDVRSPLYAQDPGLYRIPAAGGEPFRITQQGFLPHFGAAAERVYFLTFEDEDARALRSIRLDKSEERTHLKSEAATEFRVSPDGKFVAWSERFNAFIAPFVPTGKTVELGPKSTAIPVRQVSRDAGEYLHWSGDSQTLFWSLGPELFRRDLKDAFAFIPGAPDPLPEPAQQGTVLGFTVASDVPSGTIALVGGRIITLAGDAVIPDGTIVVSGNRITAVGPRSSVAIPPDAHRVDISGKTVIPGLIDVHWHGDQGSEEIVPQRNWYHDAALAFGVTTLHDPSTDTSTFFAASEMARAGLITAPRMFSTGTVLYGASGDFKAIINSLEDARSHLRRMKAVGAFSVKSYNQPRRNQRQQVIAAARELGMMVVPEGGSLFQHNMTMVIDGHTGIEHALPVAKFYDDVLQLWSKSRTGYTPTLGVGYGGIFGENYWYEHTNVWENERLRRFVPPYLIEARSRRRVMAPLEEYNHIALARGAKELLDVGVSVQLGAHGQREGLAAHWELWMLVQGGMTPLEALRAGTLNGARYLGLDADLGSLVVGKLADLVVLDENPLDDIKHSESVRYTMVNGRLFDAHTMDQIGNHPEKRKKPFWED